uniref:Reverse transcriptase domain-containing protein n=1 Tax=Tanacetum cinerariifolium TaxID=118510 RepID=A0A6L2K4W9_TANCI|nr:hypothetical protein [Tanacetum cinerariifolium]
MPKFLSRAWEKFFEIQHAQPEDIHELLHKLLEDLQIIKYLENSSDAIAPVLPTENLDNSLIPIPSESEGISDDTFDVPFCDNSPFLDVLNDHSEIFFDFNNDCTSSDDVSFEDIDYVEASPLDSKLVSIEDLKNDILCEKLLNINLLIACGLPSSDDFSPINSFKEKSMTFPNPLFDLNDDLFLVMTSRYPMRTFRKTMDECFDSGGDVDEINDFEDGYHNSEGDILYLKSLLNDDLVHHDPSIPMMSVVSILEGFTDEPPLEENNDLFDL